MVYLSKGEKHVPADSSHDCGSVSNTSLTAQDQCDSMGSVSYEPIAVVGFALKFAQDASNGVLLEAAAREAFGANYSIFKKMVSARDPELPGRHKVVGMSNSILANQLSWFYVFHVPSGMIDTACSSSLIALHMACQSLHCGDVIKTMVRAIGSSQDSRTSSITQPSGRA